MLLTVCYRFMVSKANIALGYCLEQLLRSFFVLSKVGTILNSMVSARELMQQL